MSPILVFLLVAVGAWLVSGWVFRARRAPLPDDLSGMTLLDVRTSQEFAAGHPGGAVNIPVGELPARAGELRRDRPLVVYCHSGSRSGRAARLLRGAGFPAVHDAGPMHAVTAALSRSPGRPAAERAAAPRRARARKRNRRT